MPARSVLVIKFGTFEQAFSSHISPTSLALLQKRGYSSTVILSAHPKMRKLWMSAEKTEHFQMAWFDDLTPEIVADLDLLTATCLCHGFVFMIWHWGWRWLDDALAYCIWQRDSFLAVWSETGGPGQLQTHALVLGKGLSPWQSRGRWRGVAELAIRLLPSSSSEASGTRGLWEARLSGVGWKFLSLYPFPLLSFLLVQ